MDQSTENKLQHHLCNKTSLGLDGLSSLREREAKLFICIGVVDVVLQPGVQNECSLVRSGAVSLRALVQNLSDGIPSTLEHCLCLLAWVIHEVMVGDGLDNVVAGAQPGSVGFEKVCTANSAGKNLCRRRVDLESMTACKSFKHLYYTATDLHTASLE